jgi:SAM-dependent methyltransferase
MATANPGVGQLRRDPTMINRLNSHFYPDTSRDGEVAFYSWVRQIVTPDTIMLNLGAGPPAERGPLRVFKGEVARVVGADVDPDVTHNMELDEARVIGQDGVLPFADDTFDVVFSDWTLEHVADPARCLSEVRRVLKKGASFIFRTPNKHHYVALIARVTPDWFHKRVANWARGWPPGTHEPWPTYYRMNCRALVEAEGRRAGFDRIQVQMWEPPPHYLVFHSLPFLLGVGYERLVNHYQALSAFRATIHGRMVK